MSSTVSKVRNPRPFPIATPPDIMAFMISLDCRSISLKIMRRWVASTRHMAHLSVVIHNTTQIAWCGTSKACIRRGQLDDVNMDLQNAQNADRALGELWESVLHSSNAPNDNTQL